MDRELLGTTIAIKEEHHEAVRLLAEDVSHARLGLDEFVRKVRSSNDKLWKTLHELYPEIEGFGSNFNMERMEIDIKFVEE